MKNEDLRSYLEMRMRDAVLVIFYGYGYERDYFQDCTELVQKRRKREWVEETTQLNRPNTPARHTRPAPRRSNTASSRHLCS